jgi:16S rRNA (cytosine967-C5)-methyltransferase
MNARQHILKILEDYDKRSVSLELVVESAFSNIKVDHRDKRFIFEIAYGIVRNWLTLDYVLHAFLDDEKFRENRHLMRILRIGMYQIVYLDKVPDHAAVNESVHLAKDDTRTRNFSGVVNAVLRKIIKQKSHLPKPGKNDDLVSRLSVTYSHPIWLVQRWLDRFGLTRTRKLLDFNNTRPEIFLRRKIKGLSRQQFESDAKGVCDIPGGGYKNLYYRIKKSSFPEDIRMLQYGHCTVQSESSGWVVSLLDVKSGDKLLDVCSAPGGKMSLMSELAGESGAVCACELKLPRLKKVKETVIRMNLGNVFYLVADGTNLPFNGRFDKVLLDAPCSGTGVMHRHPDARWNRKEKDIERITAVQKSLLNGVAPYIVPQGILVYATCSLEKEENHSQIEEFLKDHPEFVLEELFGLGLVKDTHIDNKGFLYITPFEHKMDGMFAARMRKVE